MSEIKKRAFFSGLPERRYYTGWAMHVSYTGTANSDFHKGRLKENITTWGEEGQGGAAAFQKSGVPLPESGPAQKKEGQSRFRTAKNSGAFIIAAAAATGIQETDAAQDISALAAAS